LPRPIGTGLAVVFPRQVQKSFPGALVVDTMCQPAALLCGASWIPLVSHHRELTQVSAYGFGCFACGAFAFCTSCRNAGAISWKHSRASSSAAAAVLVKRV
jgi:hypothetical protein